MISCQLSKKGFDSYALEKFMDISLKKLECETPKNHQGWAIFCDNAAAFHAAPFATLLERHPIYIIHGVPSAPFCNIIEMDFMRIKSGLRGMREAGIFNV